MPHAASLFWGLGLVGCRSNKKNSLLKNLYVLSMPYLTMLFAGNNSSEKKID
jgi:hypothetical protein